MYPESKNGRYPSCGRRFWGEYTQFGGTAYGKQGGHLGWIGV
jgi:hypothetical protein